MDFLRYWATVFVQMFGQVASVRVKKLSNRRLVASRHIERPEKASLPVDVRRSKTLLLQGHPWTFFCKITVRRSKYCLEISKA